MISPARNSKRAGFTLLELVLVTLTLVVLIATAVPNAQRGWETLQTERTAFTVAQMLRAAHTLAVTQSRPTTWTWNAQAHQVSLVIPSAGASTAPSTTGTPSIPDRLQRPRDLPFEVLVTVQHGRGSSSEASADSLVFFPDGTSQPATLLIGEPASPRYRIEVNGATSQVRVQRAGAPAPHS